MQNGIREIFGKKLMFVRSVRIFYDIIRIRNVRLFLIYLTSL
nr:MAG TPA: hypothetical protein [Caudoviricetes sp.]